MYYIIELKTDGGMLIVLSIFIIIKLCWKTKTVKIFINFFFFCPIYFFLSNIRSRFHAKRHDKNDFDWCTAFTDFIIFFLKTVGCNRISLKCKQFKRVLNISNVMNLVQKF